MHVIRSEHETGWILPVWLALRAGVTSTWYWRPGMSFNARPDDPRADDADRAAVLQNAPGGASGARPPGASNAMAADQPVGMAAGGGTANCRSWDIKGWARRLLSDRLWIRSEGRNAAPAAWKSAEALAVMGARIRPVVGARGRRPCAGLQSR